MKEQYLNDTIRFAASVVKRSYAQQKFMYAISKGWM